MRFSLEDGSWRLIRASSNKPSLVVVVASPTSHDTKNKNFLTINSYKTTGDKRTHNIKTFNSPSIKLDIDYKYYLVVMSPEQQSIQNRSITLVKIEEFSPQNRTIKIANIKGIN